jgi:molybdate transport repressor ModE-like protein
LNSAEIKNFEGLGLQPQELNDALGAPVVTGIKGGVGGGGSMLTQLGREVVGCYL